MAVGKGKGKAQMGFTLYETRQYNQYKPGVLSVAKQRPRHGMSDGIKSFRTLSDIVGSARSKQELQGNPNRTGRQIHVFSFPTEYIREGENQRGRRH
jgi:hypothetical protein